MSIGIPRQRRSEPPSARLMRAASRVALLAAAAILIAGCGSSSSSSGSGSSDDPATVVPASAPVYVSVVVHPSASVASDTDAVAETLTRLPDPFGRLVADVEKSSSKPLDFNADVKPWLGTRVGLFVASLSGGSSNTARSGSSAGASSSSAGTNGTKGLLHAGITNATSSLGGGTEEAAVIAVTDASKARTFLAQQLGSAKGAHSVTYRGVSFTVSADGTADGLVGGFAVIGDQSGIEAVIDTDKGGPALANAVAYTRARATEPASTVASMYVDVAGLLNTVSSSSSSAVLRNLLSMVHVESVDVALDVPSASSVAIDTNEAGSPSTSAADSTGAAQALAGLPGDSWLALSLGDVGASLQKSLASLAGVGSLAGTTASQALSELSSPQGAILEHSLLSWIGQTALFVRGSSLSSLEAALVVTSTNPALSRAAVGEIGGLLKAQGIAVTQVSLPGTDAAIAVRPSAELPVTLDVADGAGKFVIGLGAASVSAALHPASTFGDAALYGVARADLAGSMQPSLVLNVPSLLDVINALGAGTSPSVQKLEPYLQSWNDLVIGSDAGSGHTRTILTLQ